MSKIKNLRSVLPNSTETVTLAEGVTVEVSGVSLIALTAIAERYPEVVDAVKAFVASSDGKIDALDIGTIVRAASSGARALAAFVAAALADPGEAPDAAEAALLPISAQIAIATAAIRLTIPSGLPGFQTLLGGGKSAEA